MISSEIFSNGDQAYIKFRIGVLLLITIFKSFTFSGYEDLLKYIQDHRNWNQVEDELRNKGVKALTFYDIVLDYILMDAFEDLDSPPSSVTAVVHNRW